MKRSLQVLTVLLNERSELESTIFGGKLFRTLTTRWLKWFSNINVTVFLKQFKLVAWNRHLNGTIKRITCIALTTEFGGPMNFRLTLPFTRFQQITVPSLLPVSTDSKTSVTYSSDGSDQFSKVSQLYQQVSKVIWQSRIAAARTHL